MCHPAMGTRQTRVQQSVIPMPQMASPEVAMELAFLPWDELVLQKHVLPFHVKYFTFLDLQYDWQSWTLDWAVSPTPALLDM